MDKSIDELELFEDRGYVCALRTAQTRADQPPWYQGLLYIKDGVSDCSNWYLKREDALKMARVMVNKAVRGDYR